MTRVELDDGTSGELLAVGDWSLEVRGPTGPSPAAWLARAVEVATGEGALDLRSSAPLPGSLPVAGGEHALALPVPLADLEATRALGRRLAAALRPGDLVLLDGPLGAGKTSLTQGLAEALGVHGRVTSPTFVLARSHRGPVPLLHVDAFRLRGAGPVPLDDLELEPALEAGVVVVEWGAGLVEDVAASRLEVALSRGTHDAGRTARVQGHGPRWSLLGLGLVTD